MSRFSLLRALSVMAVLMCLSAVTAAGDDAAPTTPAPGDEKPRMPSRPSITLAPGMVKELLDPLELDDEQQKQVDQLLAEVRENQRQRMQELTGGDMAAQWRDLSAQMREARQNNDQEKLKELRAKMEEIHAPRREATRLAETEMHDGILKILRPEQTADFEDIWSEAKDRTLSRGARSATELRRLVMALDLSADQKSQVRRIFSEHRKAQRSAGEQPPRAADAGQDQDLRAKIDAVLTESQREALTKRLEAAAEGRSRRGRGNLGDRPAMPDAPTPPSNPPAKPPDGATPPSDADAPAGAEGEQPAEKAEDQPPGG